MLDINYDAQTDIVTVNGMKIHADMFRVLSEPTPDMLMTVVKVEDGVATIKTWQVDMAAFEAWHERCELRRNKL